MPNLDAAFQALQSSGGNQAQEALLNKQSSAQQPYIDKLKSTVDTPKPESPDLQKQPEAPKQGDFGEGAQQWVTAMSVLSAFTGAFSKQHATTALNAFGSGLKGYQEGNKQAFDEAHKQWKDASEQAIENNKILTDKYKDILEDRKLTEEEQLNGIKAVAAQYHDPLQAAATSISQAVSIYDSQVKAAQTAEIAKERLDFMKMQLQKKYEPTISEEEAKSKADAIAKGAKYADVGLSTRAGINPDKALVDEILQRDHPNVNLADAQLARIGEISGERKLGTQSETTKLAGNILDESLPSLIDAAKKVGLSESTDLNTVYNTIKRHGSDRDFQNFSTQLRAVTSDYAQLTGRGNSTVHSDEEALKQLNENNGINSLLGFRDAATTERQNILRGIDRTQSDIGGGSPAGGTRIKVSDPEGKPHTIDQSELSDALSNGWKKR